jgi:5-methylcytosine-specific restriction endonuclease McrA
MCGKVKPLSKFHKHKTGYKPRCKQCRKLESKEYYKDNKETYKKHSIDNFTRCKATKTLSSHKKRGCKIMVTIDEIENMFNASMHCPICGLEYSENDDNIYASKSLDRINNELEIRIDNTWIICYRCNTSKGTFSTNEFIEYCKRITKLNGEV